MLHRVALVVTLSLVLAVVRGQHDDTITEGAKGAGLVETVCNRISVSCMLPDDKLLLRRIARVETNDGNNAIAEGYTGGIWKVDKAMFEVTQSAAAETRLREPIAAIKVEFGIVWASVAWSNLTKPLHSALAARLYIHYQTRDVTTGIPRAIADQADFWKKYYRPDGVTKDLIESAEGIAQGCKKSTGADIIFVIDASGSIGATNFVLVKSFVIDFINSSNVGSGTEHNRIGVVKYSNDVSREFDLGTYTTKSEMIEAVATMKYDALGTNTHLGINEMTQNGFTMLNGARAKESGHPRVGIVVTDGASNQPTMTAQAAQRAHDAEITVVSVGVGQKLNLDELHMIASEPVCMHTILLEGFTEFDSLTYIIDQLTCEAPIIVSPMDNFTIITQLPAGGDQNCKIEIPLQGTTIKMTTITGTVTFYTSKTTYPSGEFHETKVEASVSGAGVLFIPQPTNGLMERLAAGGNSTKAYVFGNIKGDPAVATTVTISGLLGDHSAGSMNLAQGLPLIIGSLLSLLYCLFL